jgi:regulatory protein
VHRIESERESLEASEASEHGQAVRGGVSAEARLQKALDLAYAYVNPRERTVGEVRQHLQRRGVCAELTEAAIQILSDQGFLDDARFARLFVADKRALEQWGGERIRRGLLSRGVERHLIDAALAAEAAPEDAGEEPESELDRALAVLRRRFPDPPEDRRERNRALGMLLRKGYESELALDALAAYARGE